MEEENSYRRFVQLIPPNLERLYHPQHPQAAPVPPGAAFIFSMHVQQAYGKGARTRVLKFILIAGVLKAGGTSGRQRPAVAGKSPGDVR